MTCTKKEKKDYKAFLRVTEAIELSRGSKIVPDTDSFNKLYRYLAIKNMHNPPPPFFVASSSAHTRHYECSGVADRLLGAFTIELARLKACIQKRGLGSLGTSFGWPGVMLGGRWLPVRIPSVTFMILLTRSWQLATWGITREYPLLEGHREQHVLNSIEIALAVIEGALD